MTLRENFETWNSIVPAELKMTNERKITIMVNGLIDALYIPCKEADRERHIDPVRFEAFGVDKGEPVNWGSLSCNEVKEFKDGTFQVIIDEASPGGCPTLCAYIEDFMRAYGWEVKVETEW